MIEFDAVSVTYPGQPRPVLADVDLHVDEGEFCLVVGATGSGKSTLLGAVNGRVPHFTGGTLSGRVTVDGRDTSRYAPRDLADVVGVVMQDPRSGFVADTVEDELAFGMEALGLPADVMRRRIEETLDLLGIAELRRRPIRSLSGGQQQRVAIGSVLTTHPRVVVLDEPTSALDPGAAEDVLSTLQRLVHDLGLTVLVAEHRLERVIHHADRVVVVPGDAAPLRVGSPRDIMVVSSLAPPVVELGRMSGWTPLPLSVREARRAARALRAQLETLATPVRIDVDRHETPIVEATNVRVDYGRRSRVVALDDIDLAVGPGEVVAVMGRNGSGKSTLLHALIGAMIPDRGRVSLVGHDPAALSGPELITRAGLVPQQPADLLSADSVGAECAAADRDGHAVSGAARRLLDLLAPGIDDSTHPSDLSEGQRLALALAVVLAADPPLVLLDEPTRGLDYSAKERLVAILRRQAADGCAVVIATHDVELVAEVATRTVVLANGKTVADGSTSEIVLGSPMFAPQVAKIVAPLPWLTVDEVRTSLRTAELDQPAAIPTSRS